VNKHHTGELLPYRRAISIEAWALRMEDTPETP
jgi:hypothetical protein